MADAAWCNLQCEAGPASGRQQRHRAVPSASTSLGDRHAEQQFLLGPGRCQSCSRRICKGTKHSCQHKQADNKSSGKQEPRLNHIPARQSDFTTWLEPPRTAQLTWNKVVSERAITPHQTLMRISGSDHCVHRSTFVLYLRVHSGAAMLHKMHEMPTQAPAPRVCCLLSACTYLPSLLSRLSIFLARRAFALECSQPQQTTSLLHTHMWLLMRPARWSMSHQRSAPVVLMLTFS